MAVEQIVIHRDDIVMEGELVKQSKHMREWRQRWFVLTPQYLCSFKNQGEYSNPTEFIRLADCSTVKSAEDTTGKENSICVQTPARAFNLIAKSPADKEQWISRIGRQMVRRAVLIDDEYE